MNKEYHELVNRKKQLNTEICKLNKELRPIRYFLEEKGKYFESIESKKALQEIKKIVDEKQNVLDIKERENHVISNTLIENCSHPFIINGNCPICGRYFYNEVPKTTAISVELPISTPLESEMIYTLFTNYKRRYSNKYLDKIIEILKEAIDAEDTLSYFEEAIEEFQYDEKVKVRRLIK